MKWLLFIVFASMTSLCAAEAQYGTKSATARIQLSITVLPTFKVLSVEQVGNQYVYRVYSNMRTVTINGVEYRLNTVGEQELTLPVPPNEVIVYQP